MKSTNSAFDKFFLYKYEIIAVIIPLKALNVPQNGGISAHPFRSIILMFIMILYDSNIITNARLASTVSHLEVISFSLHAV